MSPASDKETLDLTWSQSLPPNNTAVLAIRVHKLQIPNKLAQVVTLAWFKSEVGH
jgi:hypothetical protein